jgi:photosystem II stability/assembly factor-like uncharacterized protein
MKSIQNLTNAGGGIMNSSRQFFAIIAVALLNVNVLTAQWELRYPDIPADQMNAVLFVNESVGFVVNSGGSVLMTTDGGDTWKIKAHYQRNIISDIEFVDSQDGFAISPYSHIGDDLSFIYTTDGGLHWNQGNVSMGDAVAFLPLSTSAMIKSTGAGLDKLDNFFGLWTETYRMRCFPAGDVMAPYGSIIRFQRLPGGRILALGSNDAAQRAGLIADSVSFILKSDDAGSTWATLWSSLPYVSHTFSFFNDSIGWLGAEADRIYKTTDGGVSWTLQYSDSKQRYPIKSISSPDGIFVSAVDGSGRVLRSTDSGQHWQFVQVDQHLDYSFTIKFLNPAKGFLAGPDLWMTKNSGDTWTRVSKSLKGNLAKIDFASESIGMGVGGNFIYRTLDGGRNWSVAYESPTQSFVGLNMLDSLHIWATASDSIYRSNDGGSSWISFRLSNHIELMRGIQFLNSSTGIVFEVWENDSTFNYVTTDGGNTWIKHTINNIQHPSSFRKIRFTDARHVWFANQYGAWLSRDTAKTWTLFPVDRAFTAFDFVDSSTGWISIWGGQFEQMAMTTNGGISWEFVDKPYSSQPEDMLSYRDGEYFGVSMLAAGYDGTLTQFRQGDSYVYDIPTYTGNPLHSFATCREGNVLHIWVAGDGMTVLHQTSLVTGIEEEKHEGKSSYVLSQNYPNPFNPSTTIRYALPQRSHVTLTVFNTLGQQVAALVNEVQDAGYHDVRFDASGLASGVYFYRIQSGTFVQTRKLVILR